MSNLVSILTPCFEHEKYLEDYFESLLAQTYREIELIFFDDGSRDQSWAMARGYEGRLRSRFCRVILRRNDTNIGLLRTLERMRCEITGDIVCILESDDFLYPTKVEENVAYLCRHSNVGLVHSDADFLFMDGGRLERSCWRSHGRKIPSGKVFDNLLHENFILTCTVACRASLVEAHVDLQSYRERGYRTADYPMFLDISHRAPFGYIDRSLAVYRVVKGSISHPRSEIGRLRWKLDYYRIKQDYIEQYGCRDETRRRAEIQFYRCLMQLGWVSGSAELFGQGYSRYLVYNPVTVRRWTQRLRNLAIRSGILWRFARRLESLKARVPVAGEPADPVIELLKVSNELNER